MLPCQEMSFAREIEVARKAAERAAALALRHQAAGVRPETKPDDSPVTIADRECEKLIARMIEEAFPDDGLLGEEGASKESTNGRRWIIDPIDGTRDFVRGNPLWGVLIGLEEAGEVQAGVVHLPMLGSTCWAERGSGAFRNDSRLHVSSTFETQVDTRLRVSSITDCVSAVLSLNGLNRMRGASIANGLIDWAGEFWAIRSLGGTPDAMLLAAGQMDAWIEPKVAPWDLAAPQVILEEAGAVFFDLSGKRTIYGGSAIACTPGLESAMRAFAARASMKA